MLKRHFEDAKVKVSEVTKNFAKVFRAIAKIVVPILAIVNAILELMENRK